MPECAIFLPQCKMKNEAYPDLITGRRYPLPSFRRRPEPI